MGCQMAGSQSLNFHRLADEAEAMARISDDTTPRIRRRWPPPKDAVLCAMKDHTCHDMASKCESCPTLRASVSPSTS